MTDIPQPIVTELWSDDAAQAWLDTVPADLIEEPSFRDRILFQPELKVWP